jgi:hypothetical protein
MYRRRPSFAQIKGNQKQIPFTMVMQGKVDSRVDGRISYSNLIPTATRARRIHDVWTRIR